MSKLLKALLAILILPAILYIVSAFQDYTDTYMSLNPWEAIFMSALGFIVVGLFVLAIFKAVGRLSGRGKDE